jgi:hypothetical protein
MTTQQPLVLRVGGVYRNRHGDIVGPLMDNSYRSTMYSFRDPDTGITYQPNGSFHTRSCILDLDLVEEVKLPEPEPEAPEPEALEPERVSLTLRLGGVYRTRDGRLTGRLVARVSDVYPFSDPLSSCAYTPRGRYYSHTALDDRDLVEEVDQPPTLREGGYYLSRGGEVVGPIRRRNLLSTTYPWTCDQFTYKDNGKFDSSDRDDEADLVAEVDAPVVTPIPFAPQIGQFWRLRNGQIALARNNGGRDYPLCATVVRGGDVFVETFTRMGRVTPQRESKRDMVEQLPDGGDYCAMPEVPAGYSEWYPMGCTGLTAHLPTMVEPWCVDLGVDQPFAALTQPPSNTYLTYPLFIALPIKVDENDPTSLKRAASIKACAKFIKHHSDGTASHPLVTELVDSLLGNSDVVGACYKSDSEAYVLRLKDGIHTMCTMRYAKVFKLLRSDATDEDVRKFTRRMDSAISGKPDITIEWSTVDDTYCTPMEGWVRHGTVSGSCMERFCDGNDEVFELYHILERAGHLQMIKILIDDEYVGRSICWKRPKCDEWIMDRVYCRESRGSIPPEVFESLLAFAQGNSITKRSYACRTKGIETTDLHDIYMSGLDELDNYPYMDSYEGVSSSGLMTCEGDCSILCNQTDGTGENQEDNTVEVYGGGYYDRDECTWSSYYDEWVHDEDVQEDYLGNVLHCDDVVELGEGTGIYARICDTIEVKLPDGRGGFTEFHALEA